MSLFRSIQYGDSASVDAFSRLRVANPITLFNTQTQYDADPIQMEGGNTGTGVAPAWSSSTRMVALSCAAGTGTSFLQSYRYTPYQPGKSHLIDVTFVIGAAVANAVVDVGYFDANNGIFLRQNGTSGLQVVRRTSTSGSVVNNTVDQASWNIDKLDGTGASAITLDITQSQILVIDLQFLGMGRIRIGFNINGITYYCHQFTNANIIAVPYMQSATLPVQMLITATATGSTKTSYFKCAGVISEGGFEDDLGYEFSTAEGTATAASGTRTAILAVRPKTTFNGVTNRVMLHELNLNIVNTGTNPVFYELCIGVTYSVAPTYSDINTTYSAFEQGMGGTYSGLTGLVISSGYVYASNQLKESISRQSTSVYPITLDRAGAVRANGTLSLLVTGIGGTSAMRASMTHREIR